MVTIKVLIRQNKIGKKKISRQPIYNIKYRFIKCNVIMVCKAQEVCRSPMCLRLARLCKAISLASLAQLLGRAFIWRDNSRCSDPFQILI